MNSPADRRTSTATLQAALLEYFEAPGKFQLSLRQPSLLLDGSVLITGEVDRTTEFEHGMPNHEAWRDGRWEPDPLILDEQALVVNVRDKGLVVLTGCGHAGAVRSAPNARMALACASSRAQKSRCPASRLHASRAQRRQSPVRHSRTLPSTPPLTANLPWHPDASASTRP